MTEADAYISIITDRYNSGAKNPTDINLVSLLGTSTMTGGGVDTYFEEVFTIDVNNPDLIYTEDLDGKDYKFCLEKQKSDYTQYATDKNGSELYIIDNRYYYVSNGVSTATEASECISVKYQYDYKDLFSKGNLNVTYTPAADGNYVFNTATNQYELYDASEPTHLNLDRYKVADITFKFADLGQEVERYIKEVIF